MDGYTKLETRIDFPLFSLWSEAEAGTDGSHVFLGNSLRILKEETLENL